MPLITFRGITPRVGTSLFLAPNSFIIGDVELAHEVSCFFGAVLRGDINPIKVGSKTNIQENALLHTSHGLGPCVVGDEVTVGHSAIIHGAKVSSRCIIGMHSTILDGATIGEDSIVGANSLITMNSVFPSRSLILGSPAKRVRELRDDEIKSIISSAESYVKLGSEYMRSICG